MNENPIPYRPLGLIANALEECGLSVSYSYEDLVFVESTVVLLRMADPSENVILYTNTSCSDSDAQDLEIKLQLAGKQEGLNISSGGKFELKQSAEKEMHVTFC